MTKPQLTLAPKYHLYQLGKRWKLLRLEDTTACDPVVAVALGGGAPPVGFFRKIDAESWAGWKKGTFAHYFASNTVVDRNGAQYVIRDVNGGDVGLFPGAERAPWRDRLDYKPPKKIKLKPTKSKPTTDAKKQAPPSSAPAGARVVPEQPSIDAFKEQVRYLLDGPFDLPQLKSYLADLIDPDVKRSGQR